LSTAAVDLERKWCFLDRPAQAKQKAVSKTANIKAEESGERLFVDMAGPYHETLGGNKHQTQSTDDWSIYEWCFFFKARNNILVGLIQVVDQL
jgi:hypothetical protein